ncbi:unnamed protein product [Protopolystoma xenopodis]|uniref:Uncharacterized protein n=1 Tax=Protopolystoma xenopodis TaxID=117903 RepID=A0A448X1L2_9PLAT|nr:unnamed protein product [Protopolystoma xenopodis]
MSLFADRHCESAILAPIFPPSTVLLDQSTYSGRAPRPSHWPLLSSQCATDFPHKTVSITCLIRLAPHTHTPPHTHTHNSSCFCEDSLCRFTLSTASLHEVPVEEVVILWPPLAASPTVAGPEREAT